MAKLSAHGREIGRVEYVGKIKAYMSDGAILANCGFGWKTHSKVKPGVTPDQAFANAKNRLSDFYAARPAYRLYADHVKGLAPISKRWRLVAALRMMPSDPDGIWSECCDGIDAIECDLDDIVTMCDLYAAAMREQERMKVSEVN